MNLFNAAARGLVPVVTIAWSLSMVAMGVPAHPAAAGATATARQQRGNSAATARAASGMLDASDAMQHQCLPDLQSA